MGPQEKISTESTARWARVQGIWAIEQDRTEGLNEEAHGFGRVVFGDQDMFFLHVGSAKVSIGNWNRGLVRVLFRKDIYLGK